ncbi:MAG TPA: glycosyltransferase family 2 protein, partial [bacterium]
YHADSVRRMVSHFADAGVGGVCGKLVLVNPNDNTGGQGETLYWNYENLVKRLEGRIRTVFGATGGIYAIRKRLFQPLPRSRTSINDDFLIPMRIIAKGFDVVYDDKAKAREFVSYSAQDEFRRKVRIGTGNVFTFIHILPLLHPRHGFIAFGLWSHKIIRWAVPFLMALLFLLNVGLLGMPFFRWVFGFQVLFYLCAFAGWLVDRRGKTLKPLSICFYFVGINLALLIGYVNYFTGSIPPAWDRLER